MADDPLSAELEYLRSRHRKITLPTGEPVCESDRHAWPCHADRALRAVDLLLRKAAPYITRGEYDRLTAILAGEESTDG